MTPSQAHKDWANFLRGHFGGVASVTMYGDDAKTTHIPIFTSVSSSGVVAATIGIMDTDQSRTPSAELRTELVVRSSSNDQVVSNLVSTLAFYLLKDKWLANPGTIFENMVSMYLPDTKLPHIFFTAPFQWAEWGSVALSDRIIHPLLAIPVSDAEAELATHRSGHLEELWQERGTDVFNWSRASAA